MKLELIVAFALFACMISHADAPPNSPDPTSEDYFNTYSQFDNSPLGQVFTDENAQLLADEANGGLPDCSANSKTLDLGNGLFTNAFFALFIAAMAIGLMYMGGSFFQLPAILAAAKQEINELIVTVVIALLFISFLSSATYSKDLLGFDVFKQARDYSYKMLYKISSFSSYLITANIALNSVYTIFIPIGPIRRAMTMQLGPALRPLIDGVSFSLQFLITAYGEWIVFIFLFCFIQKWFLPFFFPAGLFLRSFAQTRGAGNALIALSIALCTIYPFMFYLDYVIFNSQFPGGGGAISAKSFYEAIQALMSTLMAGGIASLFGVLSLFYVSGFMVVAIMLAAALSMSIAGDLIHLIVIFSILLPILNIFVTLTFAREVSRALGTEISIAAFAKLI